MLVNRLAVRVEWVGCDPAGIARRLRYFEMFDAAIHRLFEATGCPARLELRRVTPIAPLSGQSEAAHGC
ncbi:MAG: hypothetical protein ABSC22_14380 [Roseiarcus sp.]|jgi:acyl-CoA thioesterase FadM